MSLQASDLVQSAASLQMSSAPSSAEPGVLTPDGVFLPVVPVGLVKLQSMGLIKHAGCLELLKPVNKMGSFVLAEDRTEIRGGVGWGVKMNKVIFLVSFIDRMSLC